MTALVLLPGLDGTGRLFADFMCALGPAVTPTVVSYPPDVCLGYSELEAVVRAALPNGEPFVLLAESFSGPIAITIAAKPPPGLLGVVLCCSFARNPLSVLKYAAPVIGAVPIGSLPLGLLSFIVLGRFGSLALKGALAESLALVRPQVLRARARAAVRVDVTSRLQEIDVPILYLRATEDRVVPRASCELIVSLAPGVEVVELEAPHFLLQVVPGRAAGAVAAFVVDRCVRSSKPTLGPAATL